MRQRLTHMLVVLAACVIMRPAVAQSVSEAARHYEEARTQFELGNLDTAVLALRRSLQADPSLLSAHVLVARVYLEVGEPAAAAESLRRAGRLGADPDIVWPLRAEALFRQFEFDKLVALAPQGGLSTTSQATVHLFRGQAYMERTDYEHAEQEFRKAADLTPDAAGPHVLLSVLALRQGDARSAEARAIELTRVAPGAADAWSAQGDAVQVLGRLDEALAAYDRALRLDARHYDARLSRAGVLLDLGRLDAAMADVRALRDAQPLDPRSAYLESVVLAKQRRDGPARDALQRAATLLEEMGADALERSMQLVLLAGIASFELGSLEQAQSHLARYVTRYPRQPGPRKLLGTVLLRSGRFADAILALEPALVVAPDDYRLLALLGTAYMRSARYDIASRYLERADRLSAGAPDVRTRLAASRIGAGYEVQGIADLAALFREDPEGNHAAGMTLATMHLKRSRFSEAVAVATRLQRSRPQDLSVLNLLGAAHFGAGALDEARALFEQALASDPDFLPARINLGKLHARAGNLGEARALFRAVLEKRPRNLMAMLQLGRVEHRLGRTAEGLRWLQKAEGIEPGSRLVALALVEMQLATGDVAAARRIARAAQAREPENLEVLTALARTMVAARREDLALEVYKQMARVAGFDTEPLYRIARLQLRLRAEGDAMYTLDKALKGQADHLPSRLLRARLMARNGRVEEAAREARALLEERPDLAAAHRLWGDVLLASGKPCEADARFTRSLELEPASRNALRVFAARNADGRTAEAMIFLRDWLLAHPDDQTARRVLAETNLALGRVDDARTLYEQVLERSPLDTEALNNLAYILDLGGQEQALDYAERAVKTAPDDPAVLDTLGWMLVRRGQVERGLSYLRDAHSRAASNPEIRYHIASALVALERRDEARGELRRALASPVPFQGITDARSLLEELGD